MSPNTITLHSSEIRGLCEAAGLAVHSIDCDEQGVFTVCFEACSDTFDRLFHAQRRRGTNYHVTPVYEGKLPVERAEFRVQDKAGAV